MNDRTILLVEDNESDVELTRRALARNRIVNELKVVHDGQAAIDLLLGEGAGSDSGPGGRTATPLPALVLLDLKLPKLDGIEVLNRLRGNPRTRRLPIVILTSSREQDDLAAGYDGGANSYIRKPVDFHAFVEAIRQIGLYWLALNEQPPL
mgnify:CR=1 FL=1